jgi:hypothetical protein
MVQLVDEVMVSVTIGLIGPQTKFTTLGQHERVDQCSAHVVCSGQYGDDGFDVAISVTRSSPVQPPLPCLMSWT